MPDSVSGENRFTNGSTGFLVPSISVDEHDNGMAVSENHCAKRINNIIIHLKT